MPAKKRPAIGAVPPSLASENIELYRLLGRMKEAIELLLDQRGDPLDAPPTRRELENAGVVKTAADGKGKIKVKSKT